MTNKKRQTPDPRLELPQPAGGLLQVLSCEAAQLPAGFTPPMARVAQYPESQQLQLWLPKEADADDWQRLRLRDAAGQTLLDEPMRQLLMAPARVLLDALPWPAGELWLEISHASGGCLRVQMNKDASQAITLPQPAAEADSGEDLRFRAAVLKQLVDRFQRKLSYTSQGRAGLVHYHEGELYLSFDYEMSGGDEELLAISVPSAEQWERATGVPLERRREILDFVAETARRDQCPSWQAEIRAAEIAFVRKAPRKRR